MLPSAMISITGVYQQGAVVLDEPVDLPDGAHVHGTLDTDSAAGAPGDSRELCCDGTLPDDSPEGRRKWLAWFDSLAPVFTDEEYEQLQATLRAMRAEQQPLLEARAQRIDSLFP